MADEIQEKVHEIIIEQLGITADMISDDAKFIDDLGADSLDTVELVMAFEEHFSIEVPDEKAEELTTVGKVVEHIKDATTED